jgi:predicted lipid-binding transport protein (Tim44 family)
MLRTIFMIGVFALLGLFALKLVFGVFGVLLGLFLGLLIMAIKIAAIGLVIYLAIRIFSPDTARRMREKWSGGSQF